MTLTLFILILGLILAAFFIFVRSRFLKLKTTTKLKTDSLQEKLSNELLLVNEERDRVFAVLKSMVEGVLVIDPEERILVINPVLEKVFELEREKAVGRFFWEIIRDPDLNEMIQKALNDRVASKKEHNLLLSESIFQIQTAPVFAKDEFLGAVCVFHDVTKLKELERIKTEFVANVSHELKTPLTSIVGFIETLKEGAIEDKENRMRFLEIIDEQSKKLHRLIEDLLMLSRVESGQAEIQIKPLDVAEMLYKLEKIFEKPMKLKNIQIKTEIKPKPFMIQADSKLFEQVFSNLIDNAVKYNKSNGEILIRAYVSHPKRYIEVHDTGIGIPEEDMPRIFERFYRVDKSRARESGGTGLGLSIVKHIIERHNGSIYVSSQNGRGCVFTIELPNSA